MKHIRQLMAAVFAMAAALTGFGKTAEVGSDVLTWEIRTDGNGVKYAEITGITTSPTSLTIPSSVRDAESGVSYPVRAIGHRAFYNCKTLKEFHVPDSVREIGSEAFQYCEQLATLDLGQGVTNIAHYAFWYCKALGEINIPDSLVVQPNRLFDYCTAVTNLTIGRGLKVITSDIVPSNDYGAFPPLATLTIHGTGETVIGDRAFSGTKVRQVTIEGVAEIGGSAFSGCENLESVTFKGDSPVKIGNNAFYNCKALKEFHVPDSVREIGSEAFHSCVQLATLDLGQGVTNIGRFAFWYCRALGEINIPDSLVVQPNRLFDYCIAVTNLTIGRGLKVITSDIVPTDDYGAFSTLATLTIHGTGETVIGGNVFKGKTLRSVTLENVASVGDSAFESCKNLAQVTIVGNSLTNIGYRAFAFCPSLQGFSIPDTVRTLGTEVFRESGLETVSLGAGITSIPDRTFQYCRALTAVSFPAQVKSIGYCAFEDCTSLKTIDLGTGVTTLGDVCFYGCSQLGDVTVPAQVTSYGRTVFEGCSGLTNMTIEANVNEISSGLVAPYTSALETLTIRGNGSAVITEGTLSCMENLRRVTISGVAEIQNSRSYVRGAFELCEKLESVTFEGNSLTNIGDYAFEDCTKLTSLVFPDSVQRITGFPGCSGLKTLEFGSGLVELRYITACLPQAVRFAGGVPSGLSKSSSFVAYGNPDALAMVVYTHEHAAEWEKWLEPSGPYDVLPDTVRYIEEPAPGGEVISGSETWSTDTVHVVSGWMTLAEGATLTIAPGAIVKFRPGSGIYIRKGARCDARGARLTHIADDEFGGDTDGVEGVPVVGEYNIVPFGEYLTDETTFDRYRVKKLQVFAVRAYPRWPWNDYIDLEADIWANDPGNTMYFRLSRPDGTEERSLYGNFKAGTNGYATVRVTGSAGYNYAGKTAAYRVSANGMGGSRATADILLDLADVHYVAGSVELPYSTEWSGAGSVTVKAGDDVLLERTAPASGTVVWTPEAPGTVVLQHIAIGKSTHTATFRRLAAGTALHRGVVSNDTCWAAGQVHVVNGRIDVLGDAKLTIEPGTFVKFTDGSSIVVAEGSACEVKGVIFTHVADATVGGDTLEDGGATVPVANAYTFVGNVIDDASTEYRYGAPQALTGPITADRVLSAGVYKVAETVTVQKDVTLTLEPGTILKFDTGCGLNVAGTLSAKGTRASPIVFTSLKDDAFGGDTDGDNGRNKPAKGDWATISVKGGKADFDYVRILYGGNDGTETADQLYLDGGGRVSFRNSSMEHVFKYCAGLESGVWTMENSSFRDFYTAFRHFAACTCVNSVFYDCSYLSNNGGQVFKNCIVAKYSEGLCWKGSCTFRYCDFYNFDESAPQRPDGCGSNGNFWGDPLFSDAEGGDFRLMAGSPCIDAAEAASAPARDHFGSPRMNTLREDKPGTPDGDGMYPDIGLFEAVGISAEPMPDLAVLSVTAPSAIRPGEDMTVCYTVTNRGAAAASGVVRDTVRLRGAEAALGGQLVTLDPVGVGYSLEAGAAGEFQTTVKLPMLASGKWTVGVQVNTERDVIESSYANNSHWADAASDADLPPLGSGVTERTVAQAGKVYYSLAGFAGAGVVIKVTGGDYLAISAGGRSAVQVSPGVYYVEVPAFGADERRSMTVENLGYSTTVKIETAEDALAIWSVSPDRVANSGEASVLVTGSGFTSNLTFRIDGVDAAKVEMTGPMQALVTFDATRFAPGYPSVTVTAGEKSARMDRAFEIYRPLAGPKLNYWVEKPAAVRDGRVSVAYLCYANEGDSPMRVPVFAVVCSDDKFPDTRIGISPDAVSDRQITLCGISATAPAGVLNPGESVRLPFYLLPKDGYLLHFRRYDTPEAGDEQWFEACAENVTRLNLRGRTTYDYKPTVLEFSKLKMNYADNTNSPYAAASGYLLDPITREALSGRSIALVGGTDGDYQAVTDENGYFQIARVPDGTYRWALGLTETLSDRSTNEVVIANQADLNNCEVFATAAGRISGHVTGVNGMILPGCLVILFDSYGAVAGSSEVDVNGRFQIDGLKDGAYTIRAQATGGYLQKQPVPITIDAVHRREEIEFLLTEKGATLRGSVSPAADSSLAAVTNGTVQAITAAGQRYEALVDENGEFLLEGLADNRYCVRYYSGTMFSSNIWVDVVQGGDVTLAFVANDRPLFEPTRSMGFGSCTTEFLFVDPERAKNVTSCEWDFDSDGKTDSKETRPTHTYSALGTNTVTLTFVENGETKTSVYRNCVIVEKQLDTIYAANAIVFGQTDAGTLAVESIADGRMVLTGEPGTIPLVAGTVLNGKYGEEYFIYRVRSVEVSGGKYVLAVDLGSWDDLYEQVSMAGVYSLSKPPVKAPARKSANRLLAANGDDDNGTMIKLGLNGSFAAIPTISQDIEYVYRKVGGRKYLKWAILGELSASYSGSVEGTVEFASEKEIPIVPEITWFYPNGLITEFKVDLKLSASAAISGSLSLTGTSSMMIRFGQEGYDGNYEWLPPVECYHNATCSGDIKGTLTAMASIEPHYKIKACALLSVEAAIKLYAKFAAEASYQKPPEAGFTAGVDLELGANIIDVGWFKVGASRTLEGPSVKLLHWSGATPDFFTDSKGAEPGDTFTFYNTSLPGTTSIFGQKSEAPIKYFEWDFGDGATHRTDNYDDCPTHAYAKEGTYNARLKAYGLLAGPYKKIVKIRVKKKCEGDDCCEGDNCCKGDNCCEGGSCCVGCDGGGGDGGGSAGGDTSKSCDPNEVVGPLGVGEKRYVKPGEWLTYTIFFENKPGFDIADAQEVFVTNALSAYLDWSTFEMGEVAFGSNVDLGLDGCHRGTSEAPYNKTTRKVRTKVSVNEKTGVVDWYLRIVDPDGLFNWPEDGSGFLPSNDETHRGEAHLTYRVKVRDDAPTDVRIDNSATIVFDMNEPITTDPSWWNTVGEVKGIAVTVDGKTTTLNLIVGMPYGELPDPGVAPLGHSFVGWYTQPGGKGRRITADSLVEAGDTGLYQLWTANAYFVRFEPNGADGGEMMSQKFVYGEEQALASNRFVKTDYAFAGWATSVDGAVVYSDGAAVKNLTAVADDAVTLYAVWTEIPVSVLYDDAAKFIDVEGGEVAPYAVAATVYDGYLRDVNGVVKGAVQVKVAKGKADKKTGAFAAKATATVQLADGTKKLSFKGGVADAAGGVSEMADKNGNVLAASLGVNGLGGEFRRSGGVSYRIDGARNVFSAKDAEAKATAKEVETKWVGAVNVVGGDVALAVSIAKKGKVKVSGTAGGAKVSATSQLLVGDGGVCCVPVVITKKANLAFNLWLLPDGGVELVGLDGVEAGKAGTLKSGAAFRMDGAALAEALPGLYGIYLPDGLSVVQSGTKWVVAPDGKGKAAKAGKVAIDKKTGEIDEAKLGVNPSGLKLTYTAKSGSFKGSFKAYTLDAKGKVKSYTINVTGVMVGSVGYGTATLKKPAVSWLVTIE